MSGLSLFNSRSAAMLVLGLAGAAAPIVISAPATAANFVDVQSHWGRPFIEALAQEKIISGYSDNTFRPDQAVTRAQFAAMVQQAFDENNVKLSRDFDTAAAEYWSSRDFSSGSSSSRQLRSSDPLSRAQVLVSLANGLGLYPKGSVANTLNYYKDASTIPTYARDSIAAATEKGLVVNYPNVANFNPTKTATRADVAAFIYQALVNEGVLAPISSRIDASKYIVRATSGNNQATNNSSSNSTTSNNQNTQTAEYKVSKGTQIKVEYRNSDTVVMTPGETQTMTLMVTKDIKNSKGDILIPKNSEIEGQIVPRYNGSSFLGAQFVAQRLVIGNQSYTNLNATSSLVTGQQATASSRSTITNTALNTAAQVLLGGVTGGGVNTGDILGSVLSGGGSVAGDLLGSVLGGGSKKKPQNAQIVIDPERDLQLLVGSDFYVNTITKAPAQPTIIIK